MREGYAAAMALFEELADLDDVAVATRLREVAARDPEIAGRVRAMLDVDARTTAPELSTTVLHGALVADLLIEAPTADPESVGPYRIVRRIGAGGMGTVFLAEQAHPRREVAVKVLHPWMRSRVGLSSFRFEADVLARVAHPGIPQVYEAGVTDGAPWIAMEWVRGESLIEHAASRSPRARMDLLLRVGDAVAAAHRAGIVHRDLKPGNVAVAPDGQPKVLDFGVSTAHDAPDAERRRMVGTLSWASPEQLSGGEATRRSDVYALGRIGRALLDLEGPGTPDVPPDVRLVIAAACARDPEGRYADAAAFSVDLARALRGFPVQVRTHTRQYVARLWWVRQPASLRIAFVLGVLVVVAGAAVGLDRWRSARLRDAAAAERLALVTERADALEGNGDVDAARDTLRAFVDASEHVGTPALAAGWRAFAALEGRHGDATRQLDALASACTSASDAPALWASIGALATTLVDHWEWGDAGRALARQRELGPVPPDEAIRVLAGLGDLAGAAEVAGPDLEPLLRVLSHRVITPHHFPVVLARDGDGRPLAVIGIDEPNRTVHWLGFGPELAIEQSQLAPRALEWPRPGAVMLHGEPVLLQGGGRLQGFARGDGASVRTVFEAPVVGARASAVTADGETLYVGTGERPRALFEITFPGGPAVVRRPSRDIDAEASAFTDLEWTDLDGDGSRELVAGRGPWEAYGVAAVEPSGAWPMVGRRQLGFVNELIPWIDADGGRSVLALKSNRYASPSVFGASEIYGPARPGLWELVGRALEPRRDWRPVWPPGTDDAIGFVHGWAGDLDGDGLSDLVIWVDLEDRSATWLLRQLPGGGFADVMVGDLRPMGVADLDGDGEAEVIAWDHRPDGPLVVLGAGPAYRPDVPAPPAPPSPPDTLRTRELVARWERASLLADIGLQRNGAEHLEAAAPAAPPEAAAALWLRAGELRADAGDPDRGLALAHLAWRRDPEGPAAERAMRTVAALGRAQLNLGSAADAADGLAARGGADAERWQADAAAWQALAGAPTFGLTEARPAWRIAAPESAAVLDGGALRIRAGNTDRVLAWLPVDAGVDALSLAATIKVLDDEPGVELHVTLEDDAGAILSVVQLSRPDDHIAATREARCLSLGASDFAPGLGFGFDVPRRAAATDAGDEAVTIRMRYARGFARCATVPAVGDVATPSRSVQVRRPTRLAVRSAGAPSYRIGGSLLLDALVTGIEVTGARVSDVPLTDRERAVRDLSHARPPPGVAWTPEEEVFAAVVTGEPDGGAEALRRVTDLGWIRHMIRCSPATFPSLLRRARPDALDRLVETWASGYEQRSARDRAWIRAQPGMVSLAPTSEPRRRLLAVLAEGALDEGLLGTAEGLAARLVRGLPSDTPDDERASYVELLRRVRGASGGGDAQVRFAGGNPGAGLHPQPR